MSVCCLKRAVHKCLCRCSYQDIALVERTAATFNSPYKQGRPVLEDREPQQCVLLRAGGHMSVLDMEQGLLSGLPLP